jgi:hypothetical protein
MIKKLDNCDIIPREILVSKINELIVDVNRLAQIMLDEEDDSLKEALEEIRATLFKDGSIQIIKGLDSCD